MTARALTVSPRSRSPSPPCPALESEPRGPTLGSRAPMSGSAARRCTPLRDSRATPDGGCEQFRAVGEAGSRPVSFLLDPASWQGFQVVSGGGGIRTPEGPNGPLRFSRLRLFGSTMRAEAGCATQRAIVVRHTASYFLSWRRCSGGAPPRSSALACLPRCRQAVAALFFNPAPPRGIGLRCAAIDVYSYAEVRVTSSALTITPNDQDARLVGEPSGTPCGPFVVAAGSGAAPSGPALRKTS
jgi:hypothetical protein